jgi:hypothetical protein
MFAKTGDAMPPWGVPASVDDAFFHITRRQPFPEDDFVHRDMRVQPRMTDPVKTGFYVSFQNPSC